MKKRLSAWIFSPHRHHGVWREQTLKCQACSAWSSAIISTKTPWPHANRPSRGNSIGRKGKFRLWPCHMNCYSDRETGQVTTGVDSEARRGFVSPGTWTALPCRQLWLQLPWPMCHRTVSLWIIHGLCSSLTQEHRSGSRLHSLASFQYYSA